MSKGNRSSEVFGNSVRFFPKVILGPAGAMVLAKMSFSKPNAEHVLLNDLDLFLLC